MESEDIIDWNNIESAFEEDDTYEAINAPQWVDLSASDESPEDETWFCKSGCKHPRTVEDFVKLKQKSQSKLLKILTISGFLPFQDITKREVKGKKEAKSAGGFSEYTENKNPNLPLEEEQILKLQKPTAKSTTEKKIKSKMMMDGFGGNKGKKDRKPGLRSTFSARNLVPGREILNQITDFYAELKQLAKKGSKKVVYEKL